MSIQIYWKFYHQNKNENFQIKNSDSFHISAQNIDCGYSFFSRNKKNIVYPCKSQFYYLKVGFHGGQNNISVFSWCGLDCRIQVPHVDGCPILSFYYRKLNNYIGKKRYRTPPSYISPAREITAVVFIPLWFRIERFSRRVTNYAYKSK